MKNKKVADILVDMLDMAGVKRVYGIAGDSLMAITENIRTNKNIDWISVRHEEVAAFAAGAESQITGGLTVCAGSCGPGNMHLINGLYDCHRSRTPVLAIAAHIPSAEIGTGYFQETDPKHLFKECSHYCEVISESSQMPRILEIAMRTAIEKRGVSVIILSGNISMKECNAEILKLNLQKTESVIYPKISDLEKAAKILNSGKKITILGGAGCKDAHKELMQLAKVLQSPIVHALRGKEFIEYENPFDIGMTGLLGYSTGYHAMMDSDVLLMLGTDFPYKHFYPTTSKIIQIDIRGEQIGRRTKVDIGLVGDVKNTIQQLIPLLKQNKNSSHLKLHLKHYENVRKELDREAISKNKIIHPQTVAKLINDLSDDDAIFTCDVGTPTIWASRYLKMTKNRRLLGSFVHGSMASAMPQAMGAQLSNPKKQVIAFCGDGGLSMSLGDIITLRQHKIPAKLVVFNNSSLGFVELEMKAAGVLDFAVDLDKTNFSNIAKASGILGIRVEKPSQLEGAIKKMLKHNGPVLLDVVVGRQELTLPPSITQEQMKGFGTFLIKAILNHRGNEVVDLIKTNIVR